MATPPTPVASYTTGGQSAGTTKTMSVTVAVGDLVLVTTGSSGSAHTITAPTGGTGMVWVLVASATGVASNSNVYAWAGQAVTAETFTVSLTSSSSTAQWGASARVWRNHNGVGVSAATTNAGTTPALGLTTSQDNSAIDMWITDWQGVSGTRTYNTATAGAFTETYNDQLAGWVFDFAGYYANAGTAGAKTVGQTSPTGQTPAVVAVEIRPAPLASSQMTRWQTALASAASAPATGVFIGASKTEGQGASARVNRWLDVLAAKYRTLYPSGATGGIGFTPPWYAVGVPSTSWATTTTAASGTISNTGAANFGHRTATLSAGATQTYSVTGTDLDLWWVANGASGQFTYKIDSGTAVTVTTSGANNTAGRTQITGLAATTHTVLITAVSSCIFGGVTAYNGDRSKGAMLIDSGHAGNNSGQYNDPAMIAGLVQLAPDLLALDVGGNEQGAGLTPAQMAGNLQAVILQVRARAKIPSVLLLGPWVVAPDDGTWTPYANALSTLAANNNAVFVDLSVKMPIADATTENVLYTADGAHAIDAGQQQIANFVYQATVPGGSGTLSCSGSGSLALSGAGAVSASLSLSGSGALTLTGSSAGPGAGSISLSGAGGLTLTGSSGAPGVGSLDLSGTGAVAFSGAGSSPNPVYTFNAPVYQRRMPIMPGLAALINYSVALMRIDGEWVETEFPSEQQINAADYYFPGGVQLTVTADEAAALVAGGYPVDGGGAAPVVDLAIVDLTSVS